MGIKTVGDLIRNLRAYNKDMKVALRINDFDIKDIDSAYVDIREMDGSPMTILMISAVPFDASEEPNFDDDPFSLFGD